MEIPLRPLELIGAGLGLYIDPLLRQGDVPIHRFQGSGTSDLLTIKNGGNVGIGIDNPQEMLSVNGTIRSKRSQVTIGPIMFLKKATNL